MGVWQTKVNVVSTVADRDLCIMWGPSKNGRAGEGKEKMS